MARYQVVIGNIGTVTDTDSLKEAQGHYRHYVEMSIAGSGSAAGESVTFWAGGEPTQEHDSRVFRVDLCKLRVRVARAELALARAKLAEQRLLKRGTDTTHASLLGAVTRAEAGLKYAGEQLRVAAEEASNDD